MTQSISNFNRGNLVLPNEPTPTALQETTQKFNLSSVESYEGTVWTNVPAISNIIYAPYEAILAAGALVRAIATYDEEARLDASLRLAQQPISFFNAIASIGLTASEIGRYFKSFQFQNLIPLVNTAASVLGLALCTIELFFESLGLYRVTSFISNYYYTGAPKIPDVSEIRDLEQFKEKWMKWVRYTTDNSESMQRNLGALTSQAIIQQLNQFIDDLERNGNILSQPDVRAQTQNFLRQVHERLTLADLKDLRRKYFSISPQEYEKIDTIARRRFPDLTGADFNEKKVGIATLVANRKAGDLARRVQLWFVHELDEKLDPLIQKLSNADPQVRLQAHQEAKELLELMDIQAKKKMVAHIIGIIGIIIFTAGLIAGLCACPYIVPTLFLAIGGGIALARYYFSLGYWNSRGWHFEISECIPSSIKWIYRKIVAHGKVQEEAKTSPHHEYLWRERQILQLSDVSSFLPSTKFPVFRLSDVSSFLPTSRYSLAPLK